MRAAEKKKEKERQTEALKKLKKKPKTDEEEAQDLLQLVSKVGEHLTGSLFNQIDAAQKEIEIVKTKWLMENHLCMDAQMWNSLNLKQSILDVDLADQDLIML
jgi:hypothetical protein